MEKLALLLPSAKYDGPFSKAISVTSNDPEHANLKLSCSGRVMQPMQVAPANVTFGNVKRDSAPLYRFVKISRGDGGPISPQIIPGTLPGLGAQLCEIVPGEEYELEVWMGPPWPTGKFRDALRLTTGVDEAPEVGISISGEMLARLSTVPDRLTFPTERTEETVRSARLQWDDDKPGNILEVSSTIPDAQVKVEQAQNAQMLVVTLPASSEKLAGSHAVTIKTDDPGAPQLSIPITLRAKAVQQQQAAVPTVARPAAGPTVIPVSPKATENPPPKPKP